MTSSFVEKQLRVTLTLASGQFSGTNANTLTLSGLRMSAIIQAVKNFASQMDLNIFGMKQADMNALTVARWGPIGTNAIALPNNIVILEVNGGIGWTQIFSGNIIEASPEYRLMPDVPFHIQARFGYYAGNQAGTPLSYPNGVNAADAIQAVATAMGFNFQNNGVSVQLPAGSYWPGSNWDQLNAIATAANIDYYTVNDSIVICPKNTPRQNIPIQYITPSTGLIGYPRIETAGIGIDVLFNPSLQAAGLLQISGSDVPAANGTWMPYSLQHSLSSVMPGGPWFSSLHCLPPPTT